MLVNDEEPKEIDLTTVSNDELEVALRAAELDLPPSVSALDLIPNEDEIDCAPTAEIIPVNFTDSEIEAVACEPVSIPTNVIRVPVEIPVIPTFNVDRSTSPSPVFDFDPSVIDEFISNLDSTIDSVLDPIGTEQRKRKKNNEPITKIPSKPSLSTGSVKEGQLIADDINAEREATSPLFPDNGSDCFSAMNTLSKKIQQQTEEYKKAKEEVQRFQLDYFYAQLVYQFYNSFSSGYNEIQRLNKQFIDAKTNLDKIKIAETIKKLRDSNKSARTAKIAQIQIQKAYSIFTSQIIFSAENLTSNSDKSLELSGKIKEIPEKLSSDISKIDLTNPDNHDGVKILAKNSSADLEASFSATMLAVGRISFSYGVNSFIAKKKLTSDFLSDETLKRIDANDIKIKYDEAKKKETQSEEVLSKVNDLINDELSKMGCNPSNVAPKSEAGGNLDFKNVSTNPTIFDFAWWKKFSKLATLVNLVPLHWPVGLIIITPAALIKIPFPIIWIPLFVIATEKAICVLFIGQCGILPCPFLFAQHFLPIPVGPFESNNPYFVLAMRGPINISSHTPLASIPFPSVEPLSKAINSALSAIRKGAGVSLGMLIAQANQKKAELEQTAEVYFENLKKTAATSIADAEKQASTLQETAKKSMDAAVSKLQKDLSDTIERYENDFTQQTDSLTSQLLSLPGGSLKENLQKRIAASREKFEQNVSSVKNQYISLINEQISLFEEQKKKSQEMVSSAKGAANDIIDNAREKYNDEIRKFQEEYDAKLKDIQQGYKEYQEKFESLRTLINTIRVPIIDISQINIPALIQGFNLSIGSIRSMASLLSPKITHLKFLAELNPVLASSMPMVTDEFPVWERLSLSNVPFLLFLWKWCSAGKEKGGFFRDPF